MDANEFKTAEGSCIISEEVIASISCTAAQETPGVAGMANRPADLRGIMTHNAASKSVRVTNTENDTVLDVYVMLKQGVKIQDTCSALQKNIKVAVQSMTGRPVTRINVHVEGMIAEEKNG